MGKSVVVAAMDGLLRRLKPELVRHGFRMRGRAFNRVKPDGLVDVVDFQTGGFDPPGSKPIPGLRETFYGQFCVNLGVHVPEVLRWQTGVASPGFIRDVHCCIRSRLGSGEGGDRWWQVASDDGIVAEIAALMDNDAFPLFERYGSRERILSELRGHSGNTNEVAVPRIVCAIICSERGDNAAARDLLAAQARDAASTLPHHAAYVRQLAARMGLVLP